MTAFHDDREDTHYPPDSYHVIAQNRDLDAVKTPGRNSGALTWSAGRYVFPVLWPASFADIMWPAIIPS